MWRPSIARRRAVGCASRFSASPEPKGRNRHHQKRRRASKSWRGVCVRPRIRYHTPPTPSPFALWIVRSVSSALAQSPGTPTPQPPSLLHPRLARSPKPTASGRLADVASGLPIATRMTMLKGRGVLLNALKAEEGRICRLVCFARFYGHSAPQNAARFCPFASTRSPGAESGAMRRIERL